MKIRDKLREFLGLEGLATKVNIAGMRLLMKITSI